MSAIKGNSKESLFKITEDTATKLDNNNIRTVGQLFMTNANHTIDTARPKNMLQLTNEKLNHQHTENDKTISKQRNKHTERWNTCLALDKKLLQIQQRRK